MSKNNGKGGNGDGASRRADVIKLLRDHGFQQRTAWIEGEADSEQDGIQAGGAKSAAAKKKTEQRVKDRKNGWAECHAKAPDDCDARALVSLVAKSIKDENVRAMIWLAIRNANTIFLGEQLIHLGRIRRFIVRLIIVSLGSRTYWPGA